MASACIPRFGRTEPPPEALVRYLDALVAGQWSTAYAATQLDDITARVGPGASLSQAHFEAFHSRNRLQRYSFARVTKLSRVSVNRPDLGTPYFDVEADLVFADGTRRETFGVEGEVLGVVQVEPVQVRFLLDGDPASVVIDGIATEPARLEKGPATHTLLVLAGRHTIAVQDGAVTFTTDPLAVHEGGARVVESSEAGTYLDLTS